VDSSALRATRYYKVVVGLELEKNAAEHDSPGKFRSVLSSCPTAYERKISPEPAALASWARTYNNVSEVGTQHHAFFQTLISPNHLLRLRQICFSPSSSLLPSESQANRSPSWSIIIKPTCADNPLWVIFSSLLPILFNVALRGTCGLSLLSAASVYAEGLSGNVKRADDFTFDLFSGPDLQDDTASKAPSELEYTTGGGVP
jgi:hypothetical protein